jgi:hypothetical protein
MYKIIPFTTPGRLPLYYSSKIIPLNLLLQDPYSSILPLFNKSGEQRYGAYPNFPALERVMNAIDGGKLNKVMQLQQGQSLHSKNLPLHAMATAVRGLLAIVPTKILATEFEMKRKVDAWETVRGEKGYSRRKRRWGRGRG